MLKTNNAWMLAFAVAGVDGLLLHSNTILIQQMEIPCLNFSAGSFTTGAHAVAASLLRLPL